MNIFGPSQKELDFRKAIQVFNKFTIADCQIITVSGSEDKSQPPKNGLRHTDEQPSTSTANQVSNSGIQQTSTVTTEQTPIRPAPESSKMRGPENLTPVQEEYEPETRQTKRMKLHNPATGPYDCSPSSSIAPSSPASYCTALEIGPLTAQNTLTLRSRMTLAQPHNARQNGTAVDLNSSPNSPKQLRIINTVSRGTQSPACFNEEKGKRRVPERNISVSPQPSNSTRSDENVDLWNHESGADVKDLPRTASKSNRESSKSRRSVDNSQPLLNMAQQVDALWEDQSIKMFSAQIRKKK